MKRSGLLSGRWLAALLTALALAALLLASGVWWWLQHPLALEADVIELSIEPGTSPREVAVAWTRAGVRTDPRWLAQWFRWSGDDRRIRAGSYEVHGGVTPRSLLAKMVQGEETFERVRLIEGWTFRQWRAALAGAAQLRQATAGWTEAQIMSELGMSGMAAEGRFYPDTYLYSRGVSDLTVLRRASRAMQDHLEAAWAQRAASLPLLDMNQALVMASIIEKETGLPADRGLIAGVFTNRIRLGMALQTDPTVIYGLGMNFDGNLRKRDLLADTPFNTYTRKGLPPTPIAMPGKASLLAAVRPQSTSALYFVARGDGSSVFSASLTEHNQAVNRFQRKTDR